MAKAPHLTPEQLRRGLARFEAKYGISSAEFYAQLLDGWIGGSPDNDAWAALCGQAVQAGLITPPPLPPMPNGSITTIEWLTPERIRELLAEYETKRGISSAEFYERFNAGLEGDSADAMEWTWLYELSVKRSVKSSPGRA